MRSLYISQQGCKLSLKKELLILKKNSALIQEIQLPFLEQVFIFGNTQVTTQAIQACLKRNIPIVYLSQTGQCYGRLQPMERRYPQLIYQQHLLGKQQRHLCAQYLILAKLKNCRTLLMRQRRRLKTTILDESINAIADIANKIPNTDTNEQLLGLEGAAAAAYYQGFGRCISNDDYSFSKRTRRPPQDPINAGLSFGYQIIWNHILALIETWGLDAYYACLHAGSRRHAALASDLIEQFRAPIVDSLVLYLINKRMLNVDDDFTYQESACYLNASGRKTFLSAFIERMQDSLTTTQGHQPRWEILNRQVKEFIRYVCKPQQPYRPYMIQ
ncbi:MAG: CRISPR-associated endonuclease Cas1 [Cyanobacteria bacterium P01_C01_bin.72]